MRHAVLLALTLAWLPSRPARACCAGTACALGDAWSALELAHPAAIPRDGALVLRGVTGNDRCAGALADVITIEVRRGDELLAGAWELASGSGRDLAWRPAAPWQPGPHHVHVEIDNLAIDDPHDLPDESSLDCPTDCPPTPDLLVFDADFDASDEPSPPLPPLPAPTLTLARTRFQQTLADLACCPGAAPTTSCELRDLQCAGLYQRGHLEIAAPEHSLPPGLIGQLAYELRAGDEVLDRGLTLAHLAARRDTPTCVTIHALHVGNGQTLTQGAVCPTDADAAQPSGHGTIGIGDATRELRELSSSARLAETPGGTGPRRGL